MPAEHVCACACVCLRVRVCQFADLQSPIIGFSTSQLHNHWFDHFNVTSTRSNALNRYILVKLVACLYSMVQPNPMMVEKLQSTSNGNIIRFEVGGWKWDLIEACCTVWIVRKNQSFANWGQFSNRFQSYRSMKSNCLVYYCFALTLSSLSTPSIGFNAQTWTERWHWFNRVWIANGWLYRVYLAWMYRICMPVLMRRYASLFRRRWVQSRGWRRSPRRSRISPPWHNGSHTSPMRRRRPARRSRLRALLGSDVVDAARYRCLGRVAVQSGDGVVPKGGAGGVGGVSLPHFLHVAQFGLLSHRRVFYNPHHFNY